MRKIGGYLATVSLLLAFPLAAGHRGDIRSEWKDVERIVAIGDLHGDYGNFLKILTRLAIVDHNLHWAAGRTHLVQMGDIMDRGPEAKKILDLLMALEKEAEAAGGQVHVLLGNHEELNITGLVFRYPEYLSTEQFRSFLPEDYIRKKETDLEKALLKMRSKRKPGLTEEEFARDYWNRLKEDPAAQNQYLVHFNAKYGSWLINKNAVIKINDIVFVHGGISERYSRMGIDRINSRLREELADYRRAAERGTEPLYGQPEILYKGDGPLWHRDLAIVSEKDMEPELDRILQNLGAKHIVVAHTPKIPTEAEMKRFGGKVWIIDTGIAAIYGGRLSALIIHNGRFEIWQERYGSGEENHECQ